MIRASIVFSLALALSACSDADENAADAAAAPSAAPAREAPGAGKIAGSLSYPSDYLPADLQICAEETTSGEVLCKGGFEGSAFELDLPVGTYHVWARTDDYGASYRAYYNEAVRCGLEVTCTDRTPIDVLVEGGDTVTGVNPADWYAE